MLSIIILIYNNHKYIKDTLESIKKQVCSFVYEIILVDDGSKENYNYLLNEYNIKIIRTKHKGVYNANSVGVRNASYKYIFFMDSDDILPKNDILENLYQKIENDNLDIVYGKVKNNYKKNYYLYRKCECIIKRDIIIKNKIKFFKLNIEEDTAFMFNILCVTNKNKIGYLDKEVYLYRHINVESITTLKRKHGYDHLEYFKAIDFAYKKVKVNSNFKYYLKNMFLNMSYDYYNRIIYKDRLVVERYLIYLRKFYKKYNKYLNYNDLMLMENYYIYKPYLLKYINLIKSL